MFKIKQPRNFTVNDRLNSAVSKKNSAVSIFTNAVEMLKDANVELDAINEDIELQIAELQFTQGTLLTQKADNEKILSNINALLK